MLILALISNASTAQTLIPQALSPADTESGRRVAKDTIERQVKVVTDSEETEASVKLPVAPPGAEEQKIDSFKGLQLEGGSVYTDDKFHVYYQGFIDEKINLAQIYQIARNIQNQYRADGYLLTRVIVPEQETADGIVKLQIVEGYIQRVRVEGEVGEFRQRIEASLNKLIGMIPVNNREVERYLLLINDLPGISAKAVVRPTTILGATELLVRVEVKRFEGFALVNNRGSKTRGPFRAMLEGTANSLLSLEEQLKVVFLTALDSDEQRYASLSYSQSIGSEGLTINFSASYGPSSPGATLEQLDIDSQSFSFSSAINYPLIRSRQLNLNLEFGFEAINSDVDVLGQSSIRDRLRVFHAGGYLDFVDSWNGHSQVGFSVRQGIQALGASSENSSKLSRFEGKTEFTSLQLSMSRLQPIFTNTALLIATKGQYAFDTLLSEEEFYLGGEQFGRGYDISELTGEHGVAISSELQHNLTSPFNIIPNLQVYGFYDFGVLWNKDTGVDHRQSLASAGGGFRAMIFENFSIGFEIAKPLTRRSTHDNNKDPRFFFHVSGRY